MLLVFDKKAVGQDAAKLLMTIRQDKRSVADYAIAFRTRAKESEWNEHALVPSRAFRLPERQASLCGLPH